MYYKVLLVNNKIDADYSLFEAIALPDDGYAYVKLRSNGINFLVPTDWGPITAEEFTLKFNGAAE
jgi:hypothetical protein